jgi:TonB-linked SusC/RagA family outer membrane protein
MKLSLIITLVTSMSVTASVFPQSVKLDLTVENMAVKDVLKVVESKTNFRFFFSDDFRAMDKTVSLALQNTSLEKIMDAILNSTSATYKVLDNNIVVISPFSIQQQKISGKVTDGTTGEPLPGVSIGIEGSTGGAVTDIEGKYTITLPSTNAVLIFSFIGYNTEKIAVNDKTTIDVGLIPDIKSLQEVVVVGFGSQKKVNLTGSVGIVDSKAIEARPVQNAVQALQGTVPGLNISSGSGGALDQAANFNIRGIATIGKGSTGSPLILIDGIEGDLTAINPQDIDNISVLKDAASSSIYGSRAPFGVILVTTKKGKAGKTVINYNNSFRYSSPVLLPKEMDSYTFAQYFNEANRNSGYGDFFDAAWLQRIKDYQDGKLGNKTTIPNGTHWADYGGANDNIDWYKEVYANWVPSQEHNLSANGGNENITYYVSGNFLGQTGLIKINPDKYQRYTATAKINAKLSKIASIGYNGRFIRTDFNRPATLTNSLSSDLGRQGWPILPLYDPNGYLFSAPSPVLGLRDGGRDKTQSDWYYHQLQLVLEPLKGWRILGDLNYRTNDVFRHWDSQTYYNHDINGVPYAYGNQTSNIHEEATRSNYFNPDLYTEYSKSLGNHNFKAMVGFQSELYKTRFFSAERNGIADPSIVALNATTGTDASGKIVAPSINGTYGDWSNTGFFGRLNYDYKGRYLLEANLRYDGTSRYQSDLMWNWFPSVSVGWNIANESFWNNLQEYVGMLKIRGSYGALGNQNTTDFYPTYSVMPLKAASGNWLVNEVKPNITSIPGLVSTTLTWEKVRTWDLGLDFGAFKNRLTGTFDYFTRFTDNMVGPAPELPVVFGAKVPVTNNTDLKTYGFELSLGWNDRLHNGLEYSIRVTLADSRTKIINYPNPAGSIDFNSWTNPTYYRAGEMVGEIWGYQTVGIAKTDQEMLDHLAALPNGGQKAVGSYPTLGAGDIMYADLNGDGKIDKGSQTESNHGDLKIIGNNTPRYNFGIDLSSNWKGFDIRAFFQGVMKRDYYQDSYFFWGAWKWGIWWSSGLKDHLDYFRGDANNPLGQNLNSYYPRPEFGYDHNQQPQTKYIQNAAYIRLKNLQIGYTIPFTITKKVGIEKLRVFVSGENLWTFTKMAKMFDPETIDGGWNNSGNVYPLSKVLSFGLNVNF